MKELIEKLTLLVPTIDREKGHVILFALFMSEDAPDRWDVIVCAQWAEANQRAALDYIANKLKKIATKKEVEFISRIVILERASPTVNGVLMCAETVGGVFRVKNSNFNGLQIQDAYIFRSRRDNPRPHSKAKIGIQRPAVAKSLETRINPAS